MLTTIEGRYCAGHVDLLERPDHAPEGSRVLVTFISDPGILLDQHGIDSVQAADLRRRLSTFREDWEDPTMDAYDARYAR